MASLWACGCSGQSGFIAMSTYGAAAAKSQNDSAPWRCRVSAIRQVFVTMPVTLDAAEKEPIFSGRSAYVVSSASRASTSIRPSESSGMTTTSAIVSRQDSSLEWCSNGPMNTTGLRSRGMCVLRAKRSSRLAGILRLSTPMSRSIAPVVPEPQNNTTCSTPPPTPSRTSLRASSRSRVVCRPVPEDSVWVLA